MSDHKVQVVLQQFVETV